jgi:hypothetical protein
MCNIFPFSLPIKKLFILLLPNFTCNSWAKIKQLFLNRIKGNACYGGRYERLDCISPSVCGVHTYGGRCCFITILKIMNSIKNYLNTKSVGRKAPGAAVLTLAGEGGAL